MKRKIGEGAPCACTGFMKRALNSDFLTNLSDGLISLSLVLDLRLDNIFRYSFFKLYVPCKFMNM